MGYFLFQSHFGVGKVTTSTTSHTGNNSKMLKTRTCNTMARTAPISWQMDRMMTIFFGNENCRVEPSLKTGLGRTTKIGCCCSGDAITCFAFCFNEIIFFAHKERRNEGQAELVSLFFKKVDQICLSIVGQKFPNLGNEISFVGG